MAKTAHINLASMNKSEAAKSAADEQDRSVPTSSEPQSKAGWQTTVTATILISFFSYIVGYTHASLAYRQHVTQPHNTAASRSLH